MTEQLFKSMKRNKGKKMSQNRPTLSLAKPAQVAPIKQQVPVDEGATEVKGTFLPELQADPLLIKILSTCRAHGSDGDREFRLWLFNHIQAMKLKPVIKVEGNIYVETDPKSTVLFSCHVDTVHSMTEKGPQELAFDPAFGHVFLADKKANTCLGGDDGVGVYIMLKMLEAGVKGKYMFHTGEERGGIGSNAFVKQNTAFCEDLELVVAFDRAVRAGENPEVIHSQGGRRCASDEFSTALCKELNEHGDFDMPYILSGRGSFTDSKVYANIVPECVNVGCFYERQHTSEEYVDIVGVEKLVKAAISTKWNMLPIIRKPKAAVEPDFGFGRNGFHGFGAPHKGGLWDDVQGSKPAANTQKPVSSAPKPTAPSMPMISLLDEIKSMNKAELEVYFLDDPDAAIEVVIELLLENSGLKGQYDALRNLLG